LRFGWLFREILFVEVAFFAPVVLVCLEPAFDRLARPEAAPIRAPDTAPVTAPAIARLKTPPARLSARVAVSTASRADFIRPFFLVAIASLLAASALTLNVAEEVVFHKSKGSAHKKDRLRSSS
jgi:hypothetical protein